jgi:hypothetical protein
MAIQVVWGNGEKTIVHYQFEQHWTWQDFFEAKAHAQELINTVPHKVAVILETHHDGAIPYNLLANARKGLRTKHPQTALIVIVATRPFIRTMISTVRGLSPLAHTRVELASTYDEALAIAIDILKTSGENVANQESY